MSPAPRIGRYLITGRLGKGGMGMVYRGFDEKLEREVAIKTITTTGAVPMESQRRFEREAKSAARLQHANIVAVYELNEDRGVKFIAMELLRGTDLDALLRSGEEILLAEKLDICIQVCRGLAYAHERGVFHRDIKPANIGLLEDDGTAKIMDFGIAKMEEAGTQLTRTGMMVGTVNYMSPEQVHGKKVDGRTDIFSMGVILYQILSGERPFQGDTPTEVLYKIATEPAPPLDLECLGEIGPTLEGIVRRALEKDREKRYQTAGGMADDLQKVLDAHRKQIDNATDPGALEVVGAARRRVRDGKVDDQLMAQLETIVAASPDLVDARRTLRTARRVKERGAQPGPPPDELITELEATFGAEPTQVQAATEVQPTVALPEEPAPVAGRRRRIVLGLGAVVLVLAAAGVFLVGRGVTPPPPQEVRIPVRSLPVGAEVLVDGHETGIVTNDEIVLREPVPDEVELTFRKEGHRDEVRTVRLPLAEGEPVYVTLESAASVTLLRTTPPGAAVTLDGKRVAGVTPLEVSLDPETDHTLGFSLEGYQPREVSVAAGEERQTVEVSLEPVPPPGLLTVVARYPVDVIWRGKALARQSVAPQVELASGQQVVTLAASSVFLRRDYRVTVPPGGRTAIEAPGVGKINIRALPDNCEVLIGGTFVDYPPILDRDLVLGAHTVTFRWPDGVTRDYPVEVSAERPTFVTGRKE